MRRNGLLWIEAYEMVLSGELADAKTVIGILLTFENEKNLQK